jgi:Domain of unknown function (DUF4136)
MKPSLKLPLQFTLPVAITLLAACATTPSVSVQTDYDHSISFGRYHTYVCDAAAAGLNPDNSLVLAESLRSSLATRGLKESSASSADLYVIPRVRTKEQVHFLPTRNVTYYPSHYGQYGSWSRMTLPADVTQYTEGTLILDFVDRKTHKLVFRGAGTGVIGNTERNAAAIKKAVNQIVAQFPGGGS